MIRVRLQFPQGEPDQLQERLFAAVPAVGHYVWTWLYGQDDPRRWVVLALVWDWVADGVIHPRVVLIPSVNGEGRHGDEDHN